MNSRADNRRPRENASSISRLHKQSLLEMEGAQGREERPPKKAASETPDENRAILLPREPAVFQGEAAEAVLPFVGSIISYVPGMSITVERVLTLNEDLHLADHTFVHAPGVKPVFACLPVVPLTMAMEIMAETAACLAPGLGLIGFEDVKANRWIELADTDRLALQINAETIQFDNERHLYRIATAIYTTGHPAPAIQSCVLLAPHYYMDLCLEFQQIVDVQQHGCSGERIYEERHLFHGPTYQLLRGPILLHDRGIMGASLVREPADLFRSTPKPQLLIDPTLLDTVGQLLGIWAIERRERQVFPMGMNKLELYRPPPPPSTHLPLRIEITREEVKTLHADVEIQDGDGSVWIRIKDWHAWKFRWSKRLTEFRRLPTQRTISHHALLEGLAPSVVCCMIAPSDVAGFDTTLLARFNLNEDEMRVFNEKRSFPRRQRQWLLGRIAAKDAARIWLARMAGTEEMLHPAALVVENDAGGQPQVALPGSKKGLPRLSIAHCDEGAVALACNSPVGVDIEPIRPRQRSFLESIGGDAELRLLDANGSGAEPSAEWVTRFWCAKEAAGKLLGIGMSGSPRAYELRAVDPNGMMHISHRDSGRMIAVRTARERELVIAYAGVHIAAPDRTPA